MLSGLLLFDKPSGWTSNDAVQFLKSRLPRRPKVGHSGTLDPLATGLLVALVGSATKAQAAFQLERKTYQGTLRLGVVTETGDTDGAVTDTRPIPSLTLEVLRGAAGGFLGKRTYAAPAYSALKHRGKPLYEYARRGLEVPVKHREMEVYRWDLTGWAEPELSFEMDVASGTYVRTLGEALGRELGCGATVSSLRRTVVGGRRVQDALTEAEARALSPDRLAARVAPLAPAFA